MKKLSMLIMLAMAVAMSFFIISYNISNAVIEEKSKDHPVDGKLVMSLRKYIRENDVRSDDSRALLKWCKSNGWVDLEVFVDERLVFSSLVRVDIKDKNKQIEETSMEKNIAFPFKFSDAKADVVFYEYLSMYDRAIVIEFVIAVLFFFAVILIAIRREVSYLHTINNEIQALEGGDLNREITIKGSDEVTELAESIDEFRKTMQNQMNTIEQLEKSNRLMAAEIAHDLRTPLTSLIMYLDFARTEIQGKEPDAEKYLDKAREKSVRLKDLMDENFSYMTMPDYFLAEKQSVQVHEVLGGYIGDMMTYLESEGFHVRTDVSLGQSNILVQREAVGRVFSNLLSNIMKYAARDAEVFIRCRENENHVEVRIQNLVKVFEGDKPEGTGFGSRIVKRLMEEMDGEYAAKESEGMYITVLRFVKV